MKWLITILAIFCLVGIAGADTSIIYAVNDTTLSHTAAEETWQNLRDGAGTAVAPNLAAPYANRLTAHASTSDRYIRIDILGLTIPTDSLSGKTITSGVIKTTYNSKVITLGGTSELAIIAGTPADPRAYVAGDYDEWDHTSPTEFAPRVDYSGITSGNLNFTLNGDGISYINLAGDTVFYLVDGDMADDSFSGTWGANYNRYIRTKGVIDATESNRPFGVFEWTSGGGDTTPPASITGVVNQSLTCDTADWSWTSPGDSDYGGLKYWINNTLQTNLSNTTVKLNLTGLPGNTAITFSSKTFDLTGNLNATFVNDTVTTPACPDTTPPDSIANLVNQSLTCDTVDWSWDIPGDSDYGGLQYWVNNTLQTNLSNTTVKLNLTGLPGGTAISFSSKTFDLSGNTNASFVNDTVTTAACPAPPVAAFSADDTTVCTVDTVTFTDASSNTPTSWDWDFGDGNSSAEQNPTHIYNITGLFSVNLTVENADGSDFELKTNYINVTECAAPTPTPTPTPSPTLPGTCIFANMTGVTVLANSTNLSLHSGSTYWGLTILNATEGNVSYFQCGDTVSGDGGSAGGGEATGAAFGIVGGLIGSLLLIRREMP